MNQRSNVQSILLSGIADKHEFTGVVSFTQWEDVETVSHAVWDLIHPKSVPTGPKSLASSLLFRCNSSSLTALQVWNCWTLWSQLPICEEGERNLSQLWGRR